MSMFSVETGRDVVFASTCVVASAIIFIPAFFRIDAADVESG
jgi:hypothetical protein